MAGRGDATMDEQPDPRNRLNQLTNRQWLQATKSFWISQPSDEGGLDGELVSLFAEWLRDRHGPECAEQLMGQLLGSVMWSITPPRDPLKRQHPATFSEADVRRVIELFTKPGEMVLDPFAGVGSTLVAASSCGRRSIGIELIARWADIARERLRCLPGTVPSATIIQGDAGETLERLKPDSVDLVITSPPYWSILGKRPGLKAVAERGSKGLATRYSDDPGDLGNIACYDEFIERVSQTLAKCRRPLRPGRYMAVVVSDFRHGPKFYLYHADLARALESRGLALKGVTILVQDNKNLYPFGVPYTFISNIHHQYILILRNDEPGGA